MFGLSTKDVVLLKETASLTEEYAKKACSLKDVGGMEEWAKKNTNGNGNGNDISCEWYHSTWQYLRLLNMVAVPNWYEFYNSAISDVLKKYKRPRVFISACADYGMLAKLHESIKETGIMPEIVIYDICQSSLMSCNWYAEKTGLNIICKTGNIISDDIPEKPFDLIVTDEFLTVLKDEDKPIVTRKWYDLLAEGGTVITTIMIGEKTTTEKRSYYYNRARKTYFDNKQMMFPFINNNDQEALLLQKFKYFADVHTRHMINDESIINELFKLFSKINYTITITPGECVNPTPSCQIVATK